jgi:hypothetical protein
MPSNPEDDQLALALASTRVDIPVQEPIAAATPAGRSRGRGQEAAAVEAHVPAAMTRRLLFGIAQTSDTYCLPHIDLEMSD